MPIAKSVKRQVRSTESSHIVNTTIRLSHNAVWANQSTYEFYKEHCNEVDRKQELMDRITMKTKGSHGGHGFSLIDNTERRNDDDDQMMNQARTGNRNMDMATDMEVVRAATVETLAVGAMVDTVAEVVSKMVAMVATDEVATVDMVAVVATKEVAKMDMVSVGATEEVATVDMVAVVATDEVARVDMVAVVASKVEATRQTGNFLT